MLLAAMPAGRSLLSWLAERPGARPGGLPSYWRYPFYLSRHHADLGARWAVRLGAQPEVVSLIARHQSHRAQSPALSLLQAADERS